MAEAKSQTVVPEPETLPKSAGYSASGHPTIEQLMAEQGTSPITDVSVLHGDFWPEEESIEVFLKTLYEWRGHNRADPSA